jgi:murein DD-endopeptidase MepM/ murein hydrolase activator NlpD/uncharacterized protein YgiM (DUF1202 family)
VLASTLALLLSLTATPKVLNSLSPGSAPRAAGLGYVATAADWVYPVGNPRSAPTLDPGNANGYWITQIFNNSCDPALGQGYYEAGQYFCGHTGVDLFDGQAGGEVRATANGLVVYAADNASYGNMVRIQHLLPDGSYVYSQYEHLMNGSLVVVPGQVVAMGQRIGQVGDTGFATGPHLHFEIKALNGDGVGYTFGNVALLYGYFEPLSFVAAHTQWVGPRSTPTLPPPTAPAAVRAPVPRTEGTTASMGGEQHAVLATFYKRYHAFVVVTADHLNVRAGSGFRFAPLNSATKGARLAYLGLTGDGWVHVALPSDIVGYVARQWVRGTMLPQLPPIALHGKLKPPFVTVLDTRYPARNGPLMHDAAIEPLRRGEQLTYLGTLGSWDKVILPTGRIGWVLNWYLREPRVHINLAPVRRAPVTGSGGARTGSYVVITGDGLRLRAQPRLSAPVIEALARGTRLGFRGYHTSWVAVVAPDGAQGYVLGSYVRLVGRATPQGARPTLPARPPGASGNRAADATSRVSITDPYVVTTVGGLRLRAQPRLSAPVVEALAQGAKLSFRGYHTSWVTVVAPDGAQGYVLGSYVRLVGRATPQGARPKARSTRRGAGAGFEAPFLVIDVGHANLRAGPNLAAPVIVSERYNTRLALRGVDGPWVHVETQTGVSGWMMRTLTRPG